MGHCFDSFYNDSEVCSIPNVTMSKNGRKTVKNISSSNGLSSLIRKKRSTPLVIDWASLVNVEEIYIDVSQYCVV